MVPEKKAVPSSYLFTSDRLGFRNWNDEDFDQMYAISSDPVVMEYFTAPQTREFVRDFIQRMRNEFEERAYCYFAVEILETGEFLGFIGLHLQTFESDFTPCTDIGWRLKRSAWNNGYASEGAIRCLQYGFENIGLKEIYSITPQVNRKSEHIMKKCGMKKQGTFIFPLLKDDVRLRECVLYRISKPE